MDFDLNESQQVIAESVAAVLADVGPGRAGGGEQDRANGSDLAAWTVTWQALGRAGMLGLVLPGWMDGDDLGVLDAAVLLTEVGRAAATVPALATIMLGALPVVRWGSRDLQERVLAGVGGGEVILTAGLREPSAGMPAEPATVAVLPGAASGGQVGPAAGDDSTSGQVTGTKVGVPFAGQARWLLVPASVAGGGRAVVVVDASADGVRVVPTPASGVTPEYTVRLDAAPIAGVLGSGAAGSGPRAVVGSGSGGVGSGSGAVGSGSGGAGSGFGAVIGSESGAGRPTAGDRRAAALDDLYLLAAAGAAAQADGALAGALALTAGYVATREQFGKPLATFQAVAGEAADIYIASRTLHLAALSACWRLGAGLDATQDADVAAYWLAQEAPAALRTCHQLHGGIGLDISYPLHRYSAMVSDLARFVGGAAYRLDLLTAQVGAAP